MPPAKPVSPVPTFSFNAGGYPSRPAAYAAVQTWMSNLWTPENEPHDRDMRLSVSLLKDPENGMWTAEAGIFITFNPTG